MFGKLSATALIILSLFLVIMLGCTGAKTTTTTSLVTTSTTTTSTQTSTGTKTGSGAGTGSATPTTVTGYNIKIKQSGSTIATFGLSDLEKLATVSISAGGQNYTGPTILSILTQAGINSFTKVTIVGFSKGRLATAELPVTIASLNANYIIRKTNQNTYSLAAPDVPSDNWIIDVNELRVE